MTKLIYLKEKELFYQNGVKLGEILADVDGFYYFWPELKGGSWAAEMLKQIGELLDEMNKPWQEQIERELQA